MTSQPNERIPAVFLDRDGTIMRDVEYCSDPARVEVFPGAAAALARLRKAGYKLVIITNQSGLGRGYFTETDYHAVERELDRQLGSQLIDARYFCPDKPDAASARRKPGIGMIQEAARDLELDLARSFFVGDKAIDAECGRAAGLRTIVVQTGLRDESAAGDWAARDLAEAAEIILRHGV